MAWLVWETISSLVYLACRGEEVDVKQLEVQRVILESTLWGSGSNSSVEYRLKLGISEVVKRES